MVQNLVLTYVVVAILVMFGLGAYWAHRGRWHPTLKDRLSIVGVGLAWPVVLPFVVAFFIVTVVSHVYSVTRHELGDK